MKKILITGANSYIGTSFENWLKQWPVKYKIDTIDTIGNAWKEVPFKGYDTIYHVAAIVHVKEKDTDKYFKVNRDLTLAIAQKAKAEGVRQFVFLSTMGVYGKETGHVNINTKPNPKTAYAKSKLEAEHLLVQLEDESFKVAKLRPPLVYGKNCKGNYQRLSKFAKITPLFPKINNSRSMIFIDNLSEFVKQVVEKELTGLLFPQNLEYVNTTKLIEQIARVHNKRLVITGLFNPIIMVLVRFSEEFAKVFGSFTYDREMPGGPFQLNYETCSFRKSIEITELEIELKMKEY